MAKSPKSAKPDNQTSVVLIGFDDNGKPRAARFAGTQASQANKAAALMNLTVVTVTDPLREQALKLPAGRLYATGKGFVPTVRRPLFDKFLEAAGVSIDFVSQPDAAEETGNIDVPSDWNSIAAGHLVLADAGGQNGWWEAIVESVESDAVTLRWRGYPKDPIIRRNRRDLALLSPKFAEADQAAGE